MNADTLARIQAGTKRSNLLPLTGLAAAETIFTMATDTGSANAFVSVPLQTNVVGSAGPLDPNANASVLSGNLGRPGSYRGAAPYFNSASFDCLPFQVSVSGRFTSSAVSAAGQAFNLYQNTSAVVAGGHSLVHGLSGLTLAAGSYSFLLQATLVWDSVSQTLSGESFFVVGGASARAAIAPFAVTSPANLLFVASADFDSGTTNTVTPIEFAISSL